MNMARVLVGSVVALIGVVLLLDVADVVDAGDLIGSWWPLAIIAAAVLSLVANPRQWMVPAIIAGVGIVVLLRTTGVVDSLEVAMPVILVLIGLAIVFWRSGGSGQRVASEHRLSSFNIFSGSELASHSERFEGGTIGAIFGGAEIDLRGATPAPGARLDLFVAFGGVDIRVPEGWRVVTHGFPIFGGIDNVTAKERHAGGGPVLDMDATVLFGGVEIKH